MIRKAIVRPCKQIVDNAGEEGSVVVGHLLEKYGDQFQMGYDASKGEYVDMIAQGILDPLKVVRTALVDASGCVFDFLSVSGEVLLADVHLPPRSPL